MFSSTADMCVRALHVHWGKGGLSTSSRRQFQKASERKSVIVRFFVLQDCLPWHELMELQDVLARMYIETKIWTYILRRVVATKARNKTLSVGLVHRRNKVYSLIFPQVQENLIIHMIFLIFCNYFLL